MIEDRKTGQDDVHAQRDARIALSCAFAVALLVATALLLYLWWT